LRGLWGGVTGRMPVPLWCLGIGVTGRMPVTLWGAGVEDEGRMPVPLWRAGVEDEGRMPVPLWRAVERLGWRKGGWERVVGFDPCGGVFGGGEAAFELGVLDFCEDDGHLRAAGVAHGEEVAAGEEPGG